MNPGQLPYQTAWMSFELGGYRECAGTYCFYPYEQLPLLDESRLRGDFRWLAGLDDRRREALAVHRQVSAARLERALQTLQTEAARLGLRLPAAFEFFMSRADLQDQIPSCTACYFDLPARIIPDPAGTGGYLVRFLNDQQGVLYWYLYLAPAGGHNGRGERGEQCVLVSTIPFDDETAAGLPRETVLGQTAFCAPGFEAFLFRFWLENTLWFALSDGRPLTPDQQRYLDQCAGHG